MLAKQMGVSISEVLRSLVRAAELKSTQKTVTVYTLATPSVPQTAGQA